MAICILTKSWYFSLTKWISVNNEEKYTELAEKALISFTIPTSKGGVISFTEFGTFIEEYTSIVPTFVLNDIYKLLKDNGILILSFPSKYSLMADINKI